MEFIIHTNIHTTVSHINSFLDLCFLFLCSVIDSFSIYWTGGACKAFCSVYTSKESKVKNNSAAESQQTFWQLCEKQAPSSTSTCFQAHRAVAKMLIFSMYPYEKEAVKQEIENHLLRTRSDVKYGRYNIRRVSHLNWNRVKLLFRAVKYVYINLIYYWRQISQRFFFLFLHNQMKMFWDYTLKHWIISGAGMNLTKTWLAASLYQRCGLELHDLNSSQTNLMT